MTFLNENMISAYCPKCKTTRNLYNYVLIPKDYICYSCWLQSRYKSDK